MERYQLKEFDVNHTDSGDNLNGSSNRVNKLCLVCSLYYCVYDHPIQIKDGESYTSQGGQPTGAQLAPKHTLVV